MRNGKEWLFKEKERRNITFKYLDISPFYKRETKQIDEDALVSEIRSFNPQILIMMICYSETLDLRFLLEKTGLPSKMRINRDLTILTNGQIWEMNDIQKKFIETMAQKEHVEKKEVILTGPVGSGKTHMGILP